LDDHGAVADEAPAAHNEPDIILGSREQLLHLLAEAAEIEHTLMCSYMYAAFSLRRPGESGLTSTEAQAVERWRKSIMEIAVQEMGHLLLVANLTGRILRGPISRSPKVTFPPASWFA
jgi:hypothetical protein